MRHENKIKTVKMIISRIMIVVINRWWW
jgi:hypothetical protein